MNNPPLSCRCMIGCVGLLSAFLTGCDPTGSSGSTASVPFALADSEDPSATVADGSADLKPAESRVRHKPNYIPTRLEGVYIVNTDGVKDYIRIATGVELGYLVEIISDKPLWITVVQEGSKPTSIQPFAVEAPEDAKTFQYVISTSVRMFKARVGAEYKLPFTVSVTYGKDRTIEDVLQSAGGRLLGGSTMSYKTRDLVFRVPPLPEFEVEEGMATLTSLGLMNAYDGNAITELEEGAKRLTVVEIRRSTAIWNESGGYVGMAGESESLFTIGVQFVPAPVYGFSDAPNPTDEPQDAEIWMPSSL